MSNVPPPAPPPPLTPPPPANRSNLVWVIIAVAVALFCVAPLGCIGAASLLGRSATTTTQAASPLGTKAEQTSTTTTTRPTTTSVVVTMPPSTTLPTLSEAFCNDLRAGMSPLAIYKGVERSYSGPKEFADRAYGMAALSCPEQLKTNQALRSLLTGWGINPDA